MKSKQFVFLFLCNLILFTVPGGLLLLMPVYIMELGAGPTVAGLGIASAFGTLALGTLSTSRLLKRRDGRRLFIVAAIILAGATLLTGFAGTVTTYLGLTALSWFAFGILVVLINMFTGLEAEEASRGRAFAILFIAIPLGNLLGGLSYGPIADLYGIRQLLFVSAALYSLLIVIAVFALRLPRQSALSETQSALGGQRAGFGLLIRTILASSFLVTLGIFIGRLGTSLAMEAFDFSATAINNTAILGAVIAIPLIPLIGILSDKYGRRHFMTFGFVLSGAGVLLLVQADTFLVFALATTGMLVGSWINGAISTAMLTDLLPTTELSRGLAWANGMSWLAGIMGFGLAGFLIEQFGQAATFTGAGVLALLALVLFELPYMKRARVSQAHGRLAAECD